MIVEAKGGSATNSSSRDVGGTRYQQGTEEYARDIAVLTNDQQLLDAINEGRVRYVEVSQPINNDGSLGDMAVRDYQL